MSGEPGTRSGLHALTRQNLPGGIDLLQALLAKSSLRWIASKIRMPRLAQAVDYLLDGRKAGVWGDTHTKHLQGVGAGGWDRVTPIRVDCGQWDLCLRRARRKERDA